MLTNSEKREVLTELADALRRGRYDWFNEQLPLLGASNWLTTLLGFMIEAETAPRPDLAAEIEKHLDEYVAIW